MAIIYPVICCAICEKVISDELLCDRDYVATTHFIGDTIEDGCQGHRTHELWRFSDTAMHSDCFIAWDKRADFVQLYNDTIGKLTWGNGTYHHMRSG